MVIHSAMNVTQFQQHVALFLQKLINNENFSFIRFSDGELFVLQNKKLQLNEQGTFVDDILCGPVYGKEDFKEFLPQHHQFFRQKLFESLKHVQKNYHVGLSCPCCVGMNNFVEMKNWRNTKDETTWANLFVNSNYPFFVSFIIPELRKKKLVLICNENADLSKSKLELVKDFRIGRNAMINNFDLHSEISKWITENNIENHVFLFSASSLTNITVYELFKKHSNNTYLDIGTTLNPLLGFPASRGYLQAYWTGRDHPDLQKVCIWI